MKSIKTKLNVKLFLIICFLYFNYTAYSNNQEPDKKANEVSDSIRHIKWDKVYRIENSDLKKWEKDSSQRSTPRSNKKAPPVNPANVITAKDTIKLKNKSL